MSLSFAVTKEQLCCPTVQAHQPGQSFGIVSRAPSALQGLPHVRAPGEAEALCAALDAAGLVHACHTADGDALLFAARTVYRTLSLLVSCTGCRSHGSTHV